MKWLDNLSLSLMLPPIALLALAPFSPQPHLIEKLGMLFTGQLTQGVDIFDLCMHGGPLLLLSLKLYRRFVMGVLPSK